jgi:transcriptional regulator with XRE-family HTH domain
MKIGKRLHQVREHRNISQARIAKAVGVSVSSIQNYEHGRNRIPADRLEHLARALQCELGDLLADPSSPPPRYRQRRYSALLAKNDED